MSAPDGLLRADCRSAFGFPVRPGDLPQHDAAAVGRLIPKPAFLIGRFECRQFLQLLRDRGLVVFRDPRTLPKHPVTGRVLVSGVLGSDKKNGAQRLLFDRRPLNAIEDRLIGESLRYAGDFVRLELGPPEIVRTSLRDGKDRYCIFQQAEERIPWQATDQKTRKSGKSGKSGKSEKSGNQKIRKSENQATRRPKNQKTMDFQLELGFYGTPALPRSVCCPVVALQQNPELLIKLPSSVPLDLLFLRILCVVFCAYFRFFHTRVSPALRLLQSVVFFSA